MEASMDATNFMTKSDDTSDIRTKDSLEHAHNKYVVVSPQAELCIYQNMMTSYDNPQDTSSRLNHSVSSVTDPG